MTQQMLMNGTTMIKGFKGRLAFAIRVLFTGKVTVTIDGSAIYQAMIKNLDKDRAHKLRKLTQKIERRA